MYIGLEKVEDFCWCRETAIQIGVLVRPELGSRKKWIIKKWLNHAIRLIEKSHSETYTKFHSERRSKPVNGLVKSFVRDRYPVSFISIR